MRNILFFYLSLFLLSTNFSFAETLDDINTKLSKPAFLHAQFTQEKFLKVLTLPLKSEGQFWISQSQGIVWLVEKPIYSQVTITPQGISLSDKQSQKTAKSMEYIGKLLQNLLAGDLNKLEEEFTITVLNNNAKGEWVINLEPKSLLLRKGIHNITLSGNTFITQLVLHEATGDKTDIRFHNATALKTLPIEATDAFSKI
jgi:hypothetical protein